MGVGVEDQKEEKWEVVRNDRWVQIRKLKSHWVYFDSVRRSRVHVNSLKPRLSRKSGGEFEEECKESQY